MRLILPVLVATAIPVAAGAADRRVDLGSFDRLRVDGPVEVHVTRGSPGATVSGDSRAIEQVELRADGGTLFVRPAPAAQRWEERPRVAPRTPLVVTIRTPSLSAASVIAGGKVTVSGLKGSRVDLSLTGAGTLAADAIDADQLVVSVLGNGQLTAAGRARQARLTGNGPVAIDAGALEAGTLAVRLDGPGEVTARARYTADVNNVGIGRVTVTGGAKCTIRTQGGPVACGR